MPETTEQVEAAKTETLRLRALLGTWEGEATFCGAMHAIHYETSDDEEWVAVLARWKDEAPADTTDFREVWIDLPVDLAIFAAPSLKAGVVPDVP